MTDFAPINTSAPEMDSPVPSAIAPPIRDTYKENAFDTPPPSTKPTAPLAAATTPIPTAAAATAAPTAAKTQAPSQAKSNFKYTSPAVNFEDDAPTYLKTKVESLIYWEYPKKSATVLVGSLSILVLTQYYSLLQIIAGVFTLVTGMNWVFVNTHKQGQRFIGGKSVENISNPHSARLQAKGTYIPRDRVLRTAQLTVDVVEVITQQITKLVLIEDNWKSAISLVVSYLVWTLAKFVPTKYLAAIFVLSSFSVPRLYLQHKELVDGQVAIQSKKACALAEQYGGVAGGKVKELTEQARSFIKSKTSGAAATASSAAPAASIPTPQKTE
ncbi:Reticulon-domain-containing protein [Mucor mucedo]|uniref:Reticulon-like protein n=1 Tax=Mucor saturninus TaxID=64648 RepID=A0A8H7V462_9FUNG|nr:Reticulon-domain-containing protein [Mucor mucedo]KAG2206525.1 hypothetical protein INT47_008542 [Mucor saturninus]KAI7891494.1 Reticulon-domain-containing protein [Mucor mucedo]